MEKNIIKKQLTEIDILAIKIVGYSWIITVINTIKLVHIINIKSFLFSVSILPNIMLSIFMLTILLLDMIIAMPKLKVRIIERDISEKFL